MKYFPELDCKIVLFDCDHLDNHDVDDNGGIGEDGHRDDEDTEPEQPMKGTTRYILSLPRERFPVKIASSKNPHIYLKITVGNRKKEMLIGIFHLTPLNGSQIPK